VAISDLARKVQNIVNLLDVVRDLSAEIDDPDFRAIMDEMMDDDRLAETVVYLGEKFPINNT
jgi:hypothetical protein